MNNSNNEDYKNLIDDGIYNIQIGEYNKAINFITKSALYQVYKCCIHT